MIAAKMEDEMKETLVGQIGLFPKPRLLSLLLPHSCLPLSSLKKVSAIGNKGYEHSILLRNMGHRTLDRTAALFPFERNSWAFGLILALLVCIQ